MLTPQQIRLIEQLGAAINRENPEVAAARERLGFQLWRF